MRKKILAGLAGVVVTALLPESGGHGDGPDTSGRSTPATATVGPTSPSCVLNRGPITWFWLLMPWVPDRRVRRLGQRPAGGGRLRRRRPQRSSRPALWKPPTPFFQLTTGGVATRQFGGPAPLTGDFNGDGFDDIAVWRAGPTATFPIAFAGGGFDSFKLRCCRRRAVRGDFNADGRHRTPACAGPTTTTTRSGTSGSPAESSWRRSSSAPSATGTPLAISPGQAAEPTSSWSATLRTERFVLGFFLVIQPGLVERAGPALGLLADRLRERGPSPLRRGGPGRLPG